MEMMSSTGTTSWFFMPICFVGVSIRRVGQWLGSLPLWPCGCIRIPFIDRSILNPYPVEPERTSTAVRTRNSSLDMYRMHVTSSRMLVSEMVVLGY